VTLIVQEADRMGLDDSLEVRDQLGVFERDTLRDGLFATRVGSMKPDPKAVADLERAMATEVQMRSILMPKESDAKSLAAAAAGGADFEAAMKEAAAKNQGRIDEGEGFIKTSELKPEVVAILAKLKPGQVSAPYAMGGQFAVTRLTDRKIVQDPEIHAQAEAEALRRAQTAAISALVDELRTKYATVDRKLLDSVDFDAKEPGLDALVKDGRPVATIAGDAPITVGDVAGSLRKRLFHGTESAGGRGKLNRRKEEILDDLIAKRVVMKEAKRLGLDTKPAYLAVRDEERKELMFAAFVSKVLATDVSVSDDEVAAYYKAHKKEFTEPEMVRLDAVAFDSRPSAEAALAKLRAGADVAWMRGNAGGRLDAAAVPEEARIPATPVLREDLPATLRDALAGARPGEFRLYVPASGSPWVVQLRDVFEGKTQPLADVSGGIKAKLAGQKRQDAFEAYAKKLRAASEVKLFVTESELKALIGDKRAAS
jgi:parvulin-like peptidyl-prolyl isomerase